MARKVRQVGENRYCSDGIYFVVNHVLGYKIVQEYGTQMYMDFRAKRVYQIANGRAVGPTAYEAFGIYPWCLDALRHWIQCAVAVIYYIDGVKDEMEEK